MAYSNNSIVSSSSGSMSSSPAQVFYVIEKIETRGAVCYLTRTNGTWDWTSDINKAKKYDDDAQANKALVIITSLFDHLSKSDMVVKVHEYSS